MLVRETCWKGPGWASGMLPSSSPGVSVSTSGSSPVRGGASPCSSVSGHNSRDDEGTAGAQVDHDIRVHIPLDSVVVVLVFFFFVVFVVVVGVFGFFLLC